MQAAVEFDGVDAVEGRADTDHRTVEPEGHRLFPGPVQPDRRQQYRDYTYLYEPFRGRLQIDVVGTGQVATSFTKVFGQQTLNINVKSEVLWGIKKLELALALDNTGRWPRAAR